MAFDEETLKGILSNEETSVEDKIKSLLGEYDADVTGLKQKNGELIGNEKKLKEQLKAEQDKTAEAVGKAASLEEELKKNSPEETKKYFETQLSVKEGEWKTQAEKYQAEISQLRESDYKRRLDDEIKEAIKDIKFLDYHQDGFIARVMEMNKFQPTEIDGQVRFINKDSRDISSVIHEFSLTKEGKAYIHNPATGGGASGSGGSSPAGGNAMPLAQFEAMSAQQKMDFMQKGGRLAE
jgi:RNA processing factor Prp31